jgi:predicted ArsR family transcriptional regulator
MNQDDMASLPIDLADREAFLLALIRNLSGVLEEVIGLHDAEGFIAMVGDRIGETFNSEYRRALGQNELSKEQVALALVDLKRRIQGDFFIEQQDDEHIVLGNRRCPFGDAVRDRPSLCMMTSNVFGKIAAENAGYARVELNETIAQGAPGCRVTVRFSPSAEADDEAREYFRAI